MSYQRKTKDEWQLVYDFGYGDGKEVLVSYGTYEEAKADRKAYIENAGFCPSIEKHRVPKGEYVYGQAS